MLPRLLRIAVLAAAGLLAGSFTYGALSVVPTFMEVPLAVHFPFRVALMQHNGLIMPILNVFAILLSISLAVTVRHLPTQRNLALLAAALSVTSLLVTRFGNVPINQEIKMWSAVAPPATWLARQHIWAIFNWIRTGAAVGAFLSLLIASHV